MYLGRQSCILSALSTTVLSTAATATKTRECEDCGTDISERDPAAYLCIPCKRKRSAARSAIWYEKNKERANAYHRRYKESHREQIRQYKKDYNERIHPHVRPPILMSCRYDACGVRIVGAAEVCRHPQSAHKLDEISGEWWCDECFGHEWKAYNKAAGHQFVPLCNSTFIRRGPRKYCDLHSALLYPGNEKKRQKRLRRLTEDAA